MVLPSFYKLVPAGGVPGGVVPGGVQKTPDRKVVGSPGVQGSPKKVMPFYHYPDRWLRDKEVTLVSPVLILIFQH